MQYTLELPPPAQPDRFEFLALGDTGDSDSSGSSVSPMDAVAQYLAANAALPGGGGAAELVLHVGDVVYMTGERRLYDRNFRQPYGPFLSPESTVDHLTFRMPFLPVPGNHDYYDLGGWVNWVTRLPLLGWTIRRMSQELLDIRLPQGGSERGRAYMDAFVDHGADTSSEALPYRLSESTRLPNRYYRFRVGPVEFFALDSNTLDAAPPYKTDESELKSEASSRIEVLEQQAHSLDSRLKRVQRACREHRDAFRGDAARMSTMLKSFEHAGRIVANALSGVRNTLAAAANNTPNCANALQVSEALQDRWLVELQLLEEECARYPHDGLTEVLGKLDVTSEDGCDLLLDVESALSDLPEGQVRADLLQTREALADALEEWSKTVDPWPLDLTAELSELAEKALDVQRELALEKRRLRYSPDDYDSGQIAWLRAGLEESVRERPDAWRVVYLHHPLYSTITNHCESKDVQAVRDNLLALLQNHVHLILSGHSHAFEWIRASALPNTGIFVTGGGGQVSLRRSLLNPRLLYRHRERYASLRHHGVTECAIAGRGPAAADGESGSLYHYLRVTVTPQALTVRPVGVRRLADGYRKEEPMPVFHVSELPEGRPPWKPRLLEGVEIRRGRAPMALWV